MLFLNKFMVFPIIPKLQIILIAQFDGGRCCAHGLIDLFIKTGNPGGMVQYIRDGSDQGPAIKGQRGGRMSK